MRIPWTRAMLNAALDGSLNSAEFIVDQRFGFAVPTSCPGVPDEVLIPRDTWADSAAYDAKADELAVMFKANFERYSAGVSEAVNTASPQPFR